MAGEGLSYDEFMSFGGSGGRASAAGGSAPLPLAGGGGLSYDEFMKAPAPGSAATAGKLSGPVANLGAGANDVITGMLGAPVDAATWLLNQGGPMSPGLGIENPVGGSQWWRNALGYVGANPDNVVAADGLDRVARGTGEGVANMVLPYGIARGAPDLAGRLAARFGMAAPEVAGEAPTLGRGILDTFRSGGLTGNAIVGGMGGATGAVAAENVPEEWKPVAEMAGNLLGGGVGAVAAEGGRYLVGAGLDAARTAAAPFTPGGREMLAGRRIYNAASEPGELRGRLDVENPELVPGSLPTAYQLSGDPGLGQLERAQATRSPDAFLARRADQNAARVGAIDGMAPPGSSAYAPGEAFARQLADLDARNDVLVGAAQQRAAQRVQDLGGGLGRDEYGAAIRDELATAKAEAKANERQLWQAIDPGGALALDVSPIKRAAASIARDVPGSARPPQGEEAAILGTLRLYPDVQKFGELTALRGRLLDAIREERFTGGETPALRRMTQLRQAIDDTLNAAAASGRAAGSEAAPASAGGLSFEEFMRQGGGPPAGSAGGAAAPSVGSRVYTPSGRPLDVGYEVVDLARPGSLIASHDADLNVNPAFPAELQPRQRTRAASELQVQSIGSNLQPERLGASASVAEGAPIVGPDGVVESGNARTLGLARAYRENGPAAAAYRDFLRAQGFDTAGMHAPVLIRRRLTDLSPDERVRFTQEANGGAGLAMSTTERAAVDARRLSGSVLDLYRGGDITSAENRDFVRAYMGAVPDRNELGALATADGRLSVEGAQRIRNALLHRAYEDSGLVSALAETGDENLRAFGSALSDAAGDVARLRSDIAAGRVLPDMNISPALVEAARIVRDARSRGVPIADAVAQRDAFSARSPLVDELLRAAYGDELRGRVNRAKLADVLRFYVEEAGKQSTEARLFGDSIGAADILSTARARYGSTEPVGRLDQSGNFAGTGAGLGASRPEAFGYVDGAPGQAAAGGGGRGGAAGILSQEPLTPNFDEAARARYRAAADATRERAQTFGAGPVGQALRGGRGGMPYSVADSQVAGKFFNSGGHPAEDVAAFLRAVGDRPRAVELLQDYAASSLRKAAERADGTLDPRKVETWLGRHSDALRAFPELAERFRTAAGAEQAVAEAMAARKAAHDAYLDTAARHFLGNDPLYAVGRALNSSNPSQEFGQLAGMVRGNPEAKTGLQRAVVEFMRQRFLSNAEAGESGVGLLKSDQFQSFVKKNRGALSWIFSKEQIDSMEAVAADLQRANRSIAGTKLPGGSNTPQDAVGLAKYAASSSLLRKILVEGGAGSGGWLLGGPIGGASGLLGSAFVNAARDAGLRKVDDLVTEAMLNPALARGLLEKAAPGNGLHLQAAVRSLRDFAAKQAAVSGAASIDEDARQPRRGVAR
jgi:hypothetical protein